MTDLVAAQDYADRVGDETLALLIALIEQLTERKQNLGAVRGLEPFLRAQDVAAIVKRQGVLMPELAAKRLKDRADAASGLVVPRASGLLLPGGSGG